MEITKQLLTHCLLMKHEWDIHDEDDDYLSVEDYQQELSTMTLEQLIEETECDETEFPLSEFIELWSRYMHLS